jgi:hypothetical protein
VSSDVFDLIDDRPLVDFPGTAVLPADGNMYDELVHTPLRKPTIASLVESTVGEPLVDLPAESLVESTVGEPLVDLPAESLVESTVGEPLVDLPAESLVGTTSSTDASTSKPEDVSSVNPDPFGFAEILQQYGMAHLTNDVAVRHGVTKNDTLSNGHPDTSDDFLETSGFPTSHEYSSVSVHDEPSNLQSVASPADVFADSMPIPEPSNVQDTYGYREPSILPNISDYVTSPDDSVNFHQNAYASPAVPRTNTPEIANNYGLAPPITFPEVREEPFHHVSVVDHPSADPSRLDPSRLDLDPSRLDPSRLDPSRHDPSRLDHSAVYDFSGLADPIVVSNNPNQDQLNDQPVYDQNLGSQTQNFALVDEHVPVQLDAPDLYGLSDGANFNRGDPPIILGVGPATDAIESRDDYGLAGFGDVINQSGYSSNFDLSGDVDGLSILDAEPIVDTDQADDYGFAGFGNDGGLNHVYSDGNLEQSADVADVQDTYGLLAPSVSKPREEISADSTPLMTVIEDFIPDSGLVVSVDSSDSIEAPAAKTEPKPSRTIDETLEKSPPAIEPTSTPLFFKSSAKETAALKQTLEEASASSNAAMKARSPPEEAKSDFPWIDTVKAPRLIGYDITEGLLLRSCCSLWLVCTVE